MKTFSGAFRATTIGAMLLLSSGVGAATLSSNVNTSLLPAGQAPRGAACGTTLLSQSTSHAITAANSVSCNTGGIHADNSYFRAYPSSALPTGFAVCGVDIGIEQATGGTGATQPITINLYANTGAAFPAGTRTPIGSAALVAVPDQTLTLFNVPVTGTVPAGAELVVEVFTPDGTAGNNTFFIGSNAGGETGPSYIQSADCGIGTPTTTSAIGFPGMNIVLDALGTPAGTGALVIAPAAVNFGSQSVGIATAAQTVTLSNTGAGGLNVTALTAAAAPFALTGGTCGATPIAIAAGGSCTLDYTFTPSAAGLANQILTVTADVPGSGTIALQGTGVVQIAAAAIPASSHWSQLVLLLGVIGLVGVALRQKMA